MGRRFRTARIAIAVGLALAGLAFAAAPAQAAFHFMKIREVFPGTGATGENDAFIELQMFAGGQNFVSTHELVFYDAAGAGTGTFPIPDDVPNGENQRTILVGDTAVAGADFVYAGLGDDLITAGGAVCFPDAEPPDCVSWGMFANNPVLPSPGAGTPASAFQAGSSLERSIAPNCATLLEAGDDTNDSATDFALASPSPRNNATPPTETPCGTPGNPGGGPDTKIDKGPKKKTKKKRARFEFSSTVPGATFECNVDDKGFKPCTSPFTVKVKKGKHTFEVRAVAGGVPDGSPAQQSWKVKKPKK